MAPQFLDFPTGTKTTLIENGWHMFAFGKTVHEQLDVQVLRMAEVPQVWQVAGATNFNTFHATKKNSNKS